MSELGSWEAQGIHVSSSNVEVRVVDEVPAALVLVPDKAVTIEVLHASRAFLFPEQARHLASLLVEAAELAES